MIFDDDHKIHTFFRYHHDSVMYHSQNDIAKSPFPAPNDSWTAREIRNVNLRETEMNRIREREMNQKQDSLTTKETEATTRSVLRDTFPLIHRHELKYPQSSYSKIREIHSISGSVHPAGYNMTYSLCSKNGDCCRCPCLYFLNFIKAFNRSENKSSATVTQTTTDWKRRKWVTLKVKQLSDRVSTFCSCKIAHNCSMYLHHKIESF